MTKNYAHREEILDFDDIVYFSASSIYWMLKNAGLIPEQKYHKKKMQMVKLRSISQIKCGIPILAIYLKKHSCLFNPCS